MGSTVNYEVRLANSGSLPATDLEVTFTVDGEPVTLAGLPGSLGAGEEATSTASAPATAPGELVALASAGWGTPGTLQRFGAVEADATTHVLAAVDGPVTIADVEGRFFHAAAGASAFTATPDDTPVFAQSFPSIAFNPPTDVISGATVDPSTRPFTDVVLGPDGAAAGVMPAHGNGHQAGIGDLASFQAVFTGELEVTEAGDLTISVIADDGFVLGVEGAARVSGSLEGAPASTPFEGIAVVGARNASGPLATVPITLHFPEPGRYPFELDYFTAESDSMSLVLAYPGEPGTFGGGRVYLTGHDPDFHAFQGGNRGGAQRQIHRAVEYVTGDKIEPSLLLVMDLRNPGSGHSDPRQGMVSAGYDEFVVADDLGVAPGVVDLDAVDFDDFDAIVVASDHGGWLRQPQLDILNRRIADIDAYLSGGGGLVAFAEGSPAAGLTTSDRCWWDLVGRAWVVIGLRRLGSADGQRRDFLLSSPWWRACSWGTMLRPIRRRCLQVGFPWIQFRRSIPNRANA